MSVTLVDDLQPHAPSHALAEDSAVVQLLIELEGSGALTPTSLELPPDLDYDSYSALGRFFGELHKRTAWYIGDWLIFGEGSYGERFAQAASETGLSEHTLQNRIWVCRSIPPNRRRRELSFSTHTLVAALPAREQRQWLTLAADQGWTRAELQAQMKPPPEERESLPPEGVIDQAGLLEAATSLVRNAEVAGENVIIRREDYAQLVAALGLEV